jgi:lipopolysaccharide/colanic/teichoic acid biosynthesis glycosyltransferase
MAVEFNVAFGEQRVGCGAGQATDVGQILVVQPTWRTKAIYFAEFGVALILLILALPIIGLAALAVKLTSRGKVIYCQTRTGLGGVPYTIYKIRTMFTNCESVSGARWASVGDPRITAVGRFLRKVHVDELPQLWNVLRGEMSLVGPRPERPEFVVKLEQVLPDYRRRLLVRPGVTGLAQIQLPADTDLEGVRRKLACDLYYIYNRTLWLDVRIVFCTLSKILGIPFSVVSGPLRIPRGCAVEPSKPTAADDVDQETGWPNLQAAEITL